MSSAYYYNQQQPGVPGSSIPQQRVMAGQIGINPAQSHYLQQQQQQQQQQFRNQALNDPNAHRKRAHSKPSRQSAPLVDDADEPSGDELDDISARDIAMARYKRNHDYLSEIFTPYNAASIVPPPLDFNQTKEELKEQIEQHKVKTARHKKAHEERMATHEVEQEKFWKSLNKLNEATTIEAIEKSSKEFAKDLGVTIEHTSSNVKVLPIPGIEDVDSKELENEMKLKESEKQQQQQQQQQQLDQQHQQRDQTIENSTEAPIKVPTEVQSNDDVTNNNSNSNEDDNMDMFFNDQQQEGENTDSFFNEMVNTDDTSVNEFLNTD